MADDDLTDEEDLSLEPQEAGLAFRAEMWLKDTLLGYWMYLVAVLVLGLASVFVYSQYLDYQVDTQQAGAREVARVEVKLDGRVVDLAYKQAAGEDLDVEKISGAAAALEALPNSGAARSEALLKAAELFRLAGKPEEQKRVLEAAVAEGDGVLKYAAESALAHLELELEQADAAVLRFKSMMDSYPGYLGEQAALDLGLVHEQMSQPAEAGAIYDAFLAKWPESPRAEEVKKRKANLGAG